MSRQIKNYNSVYSICVVCEGDKTEPGFVCDFHDWIKGIRKLSYVLTVIPNPNSDEENTKRVKRKIGHRTTSETGSHINERHCDDEAKPLNWVKEGLYYLNQKTHDEVWVMFDKDGHPKIKEAFDLIMKERSKGTNIHLAFSSRCFETYLLQHFEYNDIAFQECECGARVNGHKRSYRCCSAKAVVGKACNGDKCINGYARKNGYWNDSKKNNTFQYIDNVWRGIVNAHDLSFNSIIKDPMTPVYQRNPYLTTYLLFLRLAEIKPFRNIDIISVNKGQNYYCKISRSGNIIIINNTTPLTFKLDLTKAKACEVIAYNRSNNYNSNLSNVNVVISKYLGRVCEVKGYNTETIDLSNLMKSVDFLLLDINSTKYFFGKESELPDDFDKTLFDLA